MEKQMTGGTKYRDRHEISSLDVGSHSVCIMSVRWKNDGALPMQIGGKTGGNTYHGLIDNRRESEQVGGSLDPC